MSVLAASVRVSNFFLDLDQIRILAGLNLLTVCAGSSRLI